MQQHEWSSMNGTSMLLHFVKTEEREEREEREDREDREERERESSGSAERKGYGSTCRISRRPPSQRQNSKIRPTLDVSTKE